MKARRNIDVIKDLNGKEIVIINDVLFKGQKIIDRNEVEKYLKRYVGTSFVVSDTKDAIFIGPDLPDEYARSNYTYMI